MLSKANHVLISAQTSSALTDFLATWWQQKDAASTQLKIDTVYCIYAPGRHGATLPFLWGHINLHLIISLIFTLLLALVQSPQTHEADILTILYIRNSNWCKCVCIDPYCIQALYSHKALHFTEAASSWTALDLLFLIWHHVKLHLQDLAP